MRFKAGFYSRKRRGMPQYDEKWSSHEKRSFGHFDHANDLAEALFEKGERGQYAFMAMKSIFHTSQNQCDWFSNAGFFLLDRPPVYIIRTEKLEQDLISFLGRVGVSIDSKVFLDARVKNSKHANDYSRTPSFSRKAVSNLERWYASDIEFYKSCTSWIEKAMVPNRQKTEFCFRSSFLRRPLQKIVS
jgi:hypothetical protein